MKFSIIVPALNEEKYISILLDALVNQTYKDFEIVFVDGNSEDKTVEVVEYYKKYLPINIIVSDRRGVAFQRNLGAKKAKYDHLIFFDADVQPRADFLERLAVHLNKKHVDVLTSWNEPISKKLVDKIIFGAFNLLYLETMKHILPGAVGTFIYVSKEAFNSVGGFDEKVFPGEDFDLTKRLHKAGFKYSVLKKPTIPFSVRRLDEEGRKNYVKEQIKRGVYYHTKGSITESELFEHLMGNHK